MTRKRVEPSLKEYFHDCGFAKLTADSYGIDDELVSALRRHSGVENLSDDAVWTIDPKNQNTYTLQQPLIQENAELYVDLLVGTGLHAKLEEITGRTLFMTNLMHMISGKTAQTLRWHRDSYRHRNTWIGPLPPPIKCAVYLTPSGPDNSVTGFIRGSHRFDPKNMYVDFIGATLLKPYQVFQSVDVGDAVVFEGSIIHCRRKPKQGHTREAIIFGMTSHRDGQSPYRDAHRPVIDAFNSRRTAI